MRVKDHETALSMKARLEGTVKLCGMFLFGSRARGDADPDSDMDVLVLLDGPVDRESRRAVSRAAWECGFANGVVIVPVVMSREAWENGPERSSLLAMAVRGEGVPL
jgi:predicted nucleotidyltransferase